jgi:hypothetical protein
MMIVEQSVILLEKETDVFAENLPLCLPQIPHYLKLA